ncbi:MAG: DegT/DnrJ/EryC1/StrS family aminotransferase [Candidatus Omnitrophica bacterium]|nr:DegT/DnrJ/EryC1/StrS family aminotransferase [Candidatus Omnitrophota bacterium]
MPIFKEIPPTSGWKFNAKDLFLRPATLNLEEDFKNYLGVSDVFVTYSGTAALYLIFESLKKISSKKTVVIPSYTCPLVALAALKAGLHVKVCDINRDSFDFNYDRLKALCSADNDILAIVAIHLAGMAVDFDRIKEITEPHKIFTIEDCAHALGAKYKEKKCGTLGDFSFFSLCRGKGLTIYEGGVLAVNTKEYSSIVESTIKETIHRNYFSEAVKIIELVGYWIFYRPLLFWFVFKLPQAFWNIGKNATKAFGEEYDADFDTHAVSGFRKFIGHQSFYRLEKEISRQRERALSYIKVLSAIKGIKILQESPNTYAAYPFLVVLFDDVEKREEALKKINNYGLGASIVYLNSICDYDYLKNAIDCVFCENARSLARRQLTLSTNSFLKTKDIEFVVDVLKELMNGR